MTRHPRTLWQLKKKFSLLFLSKIKKEIYQIRSCGCVAKYTKSEKQDGKRQIIVKSCLFSVENYSLWHRTNSSVVYEENYYIYLFFKFQQRQIVKNCSLFILLVFISTSLSGWQIYLKSLLNFNGNLLQMFLMGTKVMI